MKVPVDMRLKNLRITYGNLAITDEKLLSPIIQLLYEYKQNTRLSKEVFKSRSKVNSS